MTGGHTHDLDGKLHDPCPMCGEIRARMPAVVRERKRDEALARYQEIADRTAVSPDEPPRSDVHDGHAGTTTEHEVASATPPGQPTGATQQADLQGEPTTGPRPTPPVARWCTECGEQEVRHPWKVCARCGAEQLEPFREGLGRE